jgi:hypothetical protein
MATCADRHVEPAVIAAAEWLREHRYDPRERALIPDMKARFGISAKQIVEAIRLSYQEVDDGASP